MRKLLRHSLIATLLTSSAALAAPAPETVNPAPMLPDLSGFADIQEAARNAIGRAKEAENNFDPKVMQGQAKANLDALLEQRADILEQLGVPHAKEDESFIYIFVSTSMPENLLRAYGRDALSSGAILVYRGIPEGEKLQSFLGKQRQILGLSSGGHPPMVIDPRLFRSFEVKTVPTIVYTQIQMEEICSSMIQEEVVLGEGDGAQKVQQSFCAAAPEDKFYRVVGSVGLPWAMQSFVQAGAPEPSYWRDRLFSGAPETEPAQAELTAEKYSELINREALIESYREMLSTRPGGDQLELYEMPDGTLGVGPRQ